MAESSRQNEAAATSGATPYEQEFQTEMEKEIVCEGQDYDKLKNGETVRLSDMHWGRVPFELKLERIMDVADDTHKDLILNVTCNRGAPDPHWRIRFTVTVQCNINQHDEWEDAEQSMTANRKFNTLVLPVMRMPAGADVVGGATLRIKIKMKSWAGNFPAPLKSFTEKTDITDATLIVEGRHLYVSRAILSIHSSFFHNLFYNRGFADAAKDEFDLPDLSFDDMQTFLGLVYPTVTNDKTDCIKSIDVIEAMLTLAERFGCDSVTRLMEKYLMGETNSTIEGFTVARRLLLSDRFRLSAPCSHLMARLRNDDELNRLGDTDEYNELSDAIRGAILDMRLRTRKRLHSVEGTSIPTRTCGFIPGSSAYTLPLQYPAWPLPPAPYAAPQAWLQNQPQVPQVPDPSQQPPLYANNMTHSPPPQFQVAGSLMGRYAELQRRAAAVTAARAAAAAAVPAPAAPAVPPAAAPAAVAAGSWSEFQADVRHLSRIAVSFGSSSNQMRELDASMRYLRNLLSNEYDGIPAARRDEIHATVRDLIDPALQSQAFLSRNVDRLNSQVDALRADRSGPLVVPDRKRRMP